MSLNKILADNPSIYKPLSIVPVECPICGRRSNSIKCYRLPGICFYILVYGRLQSSNIVGCPSCIRKKIFVKGFTYNILTSNILWLFMILPWVLFQLGRSFTKGHSDEIVNMLFDKVQDEFGKQHSESKQ